MTPETISGQLYANYGVLGLGIIVFAYVIVHLWRHFNTRQDAITAACETERKTLVEAHRLERDALHKQLADLNRERLLDERAMRDGYAALVRESVRSSETVAASQDMMRGAFEELGDMLRDGRKAGGE